MVSVTFHQVCITTLSLGLACGIAACAMPRWNGAGSRLFDLPDNTEGNSIKSLIIIGLAIMGFALLLEILMMVVDSFKNNRAVRIICLVCCLLSVVALVSGMGVYGSQYSTGGYSVWLLTACSVFAVEALVFYVVQWRFS